MIIDILHPYTDRFDKAYLVNSQDRNSVCLYSSITKERMTTSYARYLMANKLGRYLLDYEEVDHIDNNGSNDDVDNLQLLTSAENCKKYRSHVGRLMVEYCCPVCEKVFSVRRGQSHLVKKNKTAVACSRSCSGKLSHMKIPNKIQVLREYKKH